MAIEWWEEKASEETWGLEINYLPPGLLGL